jgi:glycerol-3-phosphate acyltransferase PlsY
MIWTTVVLIFCSYLIGTFPYMSILARLKGMDFSEEEDLHMATWHKIGRLQGLSAVAVDVIKGIIPVIICSLLKYPDYTVILCGLAAVCGQMWPFFRRFNGEKGNTTGLGVFTGVSIAYGLPLFFFIGVIPLLTGFLVRTVPRFMERRQSMNEKLKLGGPPSNGLPIGMLCTFALMPLLIWWLTLSMPLVLGFIALVLLIIIRRITAGISADLKVRETSKANIISTVSC